MSKGTSRRLTTIAYLKYVGEGEAADNVNLQIAVCDLTHIENLKSMVVDNLKSSCQCMSQINMNSL